MFDVSQEGSEIQHWWNSFGKLYKDYIIIDDRTDFFDYQKSKLIQVNPQVGLFIRCCVFIKLILWIELLLILKINRSFTWLQIK